MASRDPPYDPYIPAGTGASGGEYSGQNGGNTRTAALQAVGDYYVLHLLHRVASIDAFLYHISNVWKQSRESRARPAKAWPKTCGTSSHQPTAICFDSIARLRTNPLRKCPEYDRVLASCAEIWLELSFRNTTIANFLNRSKSMILSMS